MNDTHGVTGKGWYGFDLDGTLAVYDKWEGIDHIGEPVAPMVFLIKKLHESGEVVKILTARVAPRSNTEYKPNPHFGKLPNGFRLDVPHILGEDARLWCEDRYHEEQWDAKMFIVDWCANHLGFIPEITYEKDHLMLGLYDDRVKQVVPNKGILIEHQLGVLKTDCENLKKNNSALVNTNNILLHRLDNLSYRIANQKEQSLEFFDYAAMCIGKIFIWTSVVWALVAGVPELISRVIR